MILCQEVIWTSHLTSTYCMRPAGHVGEHYIYNKEPSKEELEALKVEETKCPTE
jgi:hypothetical protein